MPFEDITKEQIESEMKVLHEKNREFRHDLNGALTILCGSVELMKHQMGKGIPTKDLVKYLDAMEIALDRIKELAEGLSR